MESLLDPFDGLRAMWHATLGHISPLPHHSLAVRRSETSYLPSYDVQSRFSQLDVHGCSVWFGVQSHCFVLAFRAIVHFPFVIQSRCFSSTSRVIVSVSAFRVIIFFSFSASRAISIFSLGVQSHQHFQSWRSEPSSLLSFWRSEPSSFSVWHSEPSSFLNFGV